MRLKFVDRHYFLAYFQVNEEPGTYFWHGHAGVEKVDNFFGPLIVRPQGPEPIRYDEERILLLTDNYHEEAAPLTFGLNRYTSLALPCHLTPVHQNKTKTHFI